jgi:hypothetical protein
MKKVKVIPKPTRHKICKFALENYKLYVANTRSHLSHGLCWELQNAIFRILKPNDWDHIGLHPSRMEYDYLIILIPEFKKEIPSNLRGYGFPIHTRWWPVKDYNIRYTALNNMIRNTNPKKQTK